MNKVILIGGGSGSGKTTIATALAKRLGDATIFSIDNYCVSHDELPLEERAKRNFDEPSSYDGPEASIHIAQLKNGEDVDIPVYDFSVHLRAKETLHIKASKYLFVDSIFALYYPEILALADYKIFIDCPDMIRLERRTKRDIVERGRTKESVEKQFYETVLPMHKIYIEPSKKNADLIVDTGREAWISESELDSIAEKIR